MMKDVGCPAGAGQRKDGNEGSVLLPKPSEDRMSNRKSSTVVLHSPNLKLPTDKKRLSRYMYLSDLFTAARRALATKGVVAETELTKSRQRFDASGLIVIRNLHRFYPKDTRLELREGVWHLVAVGGSS